LPTAPGAKDQAARKRPSTAALPPGWMWRPRDWAGAAMVTSPAGSSRSKARSRRARPA